VVFQVRELIESVDPGHEGEVIATRARVRSDWPTLITALVAREGEGRKKRERKRKRKEKKGKEKRKKPSTRPTNGRDNF